MKCHNTINFYTTKLLLALFTTFLLSVTYAAENPAPYFLPEVENHEFASEFVNELFEIHVQVPLSRNDVEERFPVLYITDSSKGVLFDEISSGLQLGGHVPRFISVAIGYKLDHRLSGLAVRRRDLTPSYWNLYTENGEVITSGLDKLISGIKPIPDAQNSGGADEFLNFIKNELIPYIDNNYPTIPGDRAYYGHSLGGLLGLHALIEAPDLFSKFVLSSPATFWDDELILKSAQAFSNTSAMLNHRLYLGVGALEEVGVQAAGDRYVTNIFRLESIFRSGNISGLEVMTQVFPDESHLSVGSMAFSRGLRFIYDKPRFPFFMEAFMN